MDKTQTILAMILVAIVFGVGGYAVQNFKIADLNTEINGLEARNDVLNTDLNDVSAVSEAQIQQIANLNRQIDSIGKEIESLNKANVAKDDVIKSKDIALQKLITEKELAEQRANELEQKFELQKQEVETASQTEGVIFDEISLNENYKTYVADNYDLKQLVNNEISFDEGSWVKEYLYVKAKPINSFNENELSETTVLKTDQKGIIYKYDFETPISVNKINGAEGNDTELLSITLLGKKIDIVKIDGISMKVKEGTLKYIKLGDTIEYNGKSITLDMITDDMIFVTVDGTEGYVKEDMTKTISEVDIYLSGLATTSGFEGAVVIIGSDVYKEYKKGSDDFGKNFIFDYNISGNELSYITITYNPARENIDNDEGFTPFVKDESFNFLDYFSLTYLGVEEVKYTDYTIDFGSYTKNGSSISTKMLRISTEKDIIEIQTDNGIDRVNKIYFDNESTPCRFEYKINDKKRIADADKVSLKSGKIVTKFSTSNSDKFVINTPTMEPIELTTVYGDEYTGFGKEDKEESEDIKLDNIEIGTEDETVVSTSGIKVFNPKDNLESDRVKISIPDKIVKASFVIN